MRLVCVFASGHANGNRLVSDCVRLSSLIVVDTPLMPSTLLTRGQSISAPSLHALQLELLQGHVGLGGRAMHVGVGEDLYELALPM
jgi:hypothetical protein